MAALDCPIASPILDFIKTCGSITMLATLLVVCLAVFAPEADFFYTKSIVALRDQVRHLEVARELVKNHAAAQKTKLLQLRLKNAQLETAHEVMDQDVGAQQEQLVQLQLDSERLAVLRSAMTRTKKDQKDSLRNAEQRIVDLQSQNVGLAKKLMALRRQIFRSEQENPDSEELFEEIVHAKTLAKENIDPIEDYNTDSSSSTKVDTAPRASIWARKLRQEIRNYLICNYMTQSRSNERTLPRLYSLPTTGSSIDVKIGATTNATKSEQALRKRLIESIDLGLAGMRSRGWFDDDFDVAKCDYEEAGGFDEVSCLGTIMELD
ncbi:hypothetical protein SLS60_011694 [Paraconiothyrium brasiliense]|uniref:Uncharacterized protein n=1 Tax=Paraconiothyrium brasiliense TaxID=300254 RepID=A0ABR3QHQ8_9PLEO